MCRLALFNRLGINHVESTVGINNLFDHLERTLGGHGNGYSIIFNNGKIRVKKGEKLTNEEITNDIFKCYNNIKWLMYHTRLASMGIINDRNCHPFKDKNKNVLMMNGTELSVKKYITGNQTDTETILNICNTFEVTLQEGTKAFNSVFVGYSNNKVFANKNYGSLKYLHNNSESIIFASEFLPEQYKTKKIYQAPQHWQEGEKIDITKLKKCSTVIPKWTNYLTDDEYYSYLPSKYRIASIYK